MSNASSIVSGAPSRKLKRERETQENLPDDDSNTATSPSSTGATGATTSNFRNVSACNRCRNRKNRCDQKLPRCTNCERANVKCVGFDPVSKREIPRSYVYYLETRVRNLENLLTAHGIPCPPASDDFPIDDTIKPGVNVPFPIQEEDPSSSNARPTSKQSKARESQPALDPVLEQHDVAERLDKLASNTGMVSVQNERRSRSRASLSGPSASASGISFARVVFAAVKRSVNGSHTSSPSEKSGPRVPFKQAQHSPSAQDGTERVSPLRDSFFGLYSRPNFKPAPFPDKTLGTHLTDLYFEYANPQIPMLHRGEFMALFDRVYATDPSKRTPRELYMLNIVFAIGSGIIMDTPDAERTVAETTDKPSGPGEGDAHGRKRLRLASYQHQPEEYHASAVIHLESFLASAPVMPGAAGGLEELQAVLLLAGLALLRPVAPGLWYIIGVAMRLSVDLGLHTEEIDHELDNSAIGLEEDDSGGLGKKQWVRDLRRRLWWCVFNMDRLVSSCVGRPVSISETVVTTEFSSLLDDTYITPSGFLKPPSAMEMPSYKFVSRHYLRLRLLQSEMMQVLQQRQGDQARQLGANRFNEYIIPGLNSPFLQPFGSFREWRADIDRRLWQWKEEAPQQMDTGVAFTPLYYDLNFWQAIIMLYRQSLAVPEPLANELSPATGEDVQSPGTANMELEEDKQMVFLKVAQAGQTVLKIYRQLHRLKLVNYTFLATHHLFMSGISFLYAIWGSNLVRSQLTMDDVDFTILAATSVLSDLIPKCPPAEACRDAFVRMSKATISMVMGTTGFGNASTLSIRASDKHESYFESHPTIAAATIPSPVMRRPVPSFDMNLRDLFSEEELASRPARPQFAPSSGPAGNNVGVTAPSQQSPQGLQTASPFSDNTTRIPVSGQYHPTSYAPLDRPLSPPHAATNPTAAAAPDWTDFSNLGLDFLDEFILPATAAADLGTGPGAGPGDPAEPWNAAGGPNFTGSTPSALGTTSAGLTAQGFDSSGAWEANGELFDAFFFGPTGGNGATGF